MVLGSAASAVTLLWFGLSGGFAGAAAARVVAGLLNGIIVAWKCSIGESCTPLEQGRVRRAQVAQRVCALGGLLAAVAARPGRREGAGRADAASRAAPLQLACLSFPHLLLVCVCVLQVLSLMSLSWGIGCILGPSIGGVASSPCGHSWASTLPGCGLHGLLRHRWDGCRGGEHHSTTA